MYCRRISSGVAPFTSIEPRLRISGERTSSPLERVRASDGVGFLAERAKEPADDLRLAVQRDEPLLERAREPHPVVELEPLFAREKAADGVSVTARRCRRVRSARTRVQYAGPSPSVIRRFERVGRIFGAMQRHEEALHVAVETALAHLVGFDLDEGVVAALGADRQT